jgi:predicted NBD/HSP70 family sugar kinase
MPARSSPARSSTRHGRYRPREAFRGSLIAFIRQTWEASGLSPRRLGRIAVGVQGTTDIAGRMFLRSPMTPLTDLPIADWLEDEFGVPVRLANDCDLIAKALNWRDPERYDDNFAAILLAHGVGMGLFLRGQIVNGTQSSGTEFGHMMYKAGGALCRCGARGCIEANAGDYAIMRRYRQQPFDAMPTSHVSARDLARAASAAREGDPLARETFAAAGRALGSGLAGIFALIDPFRVAFAGHGAIAFDLMEPALRDILGESNASRCQGHSDRPLCRRNAARPRRLRHRRPIRDRRRPGRPHVGRGAGVMR